MHFPAQTNTHTETHGYKLMPNNLPLTLKRPTRKKKKPWENKLYLSSHCLFTLLLPFFLTFISPLAHSKFRCHGHHLPLQFCQPYWIIDSWSVRMWVKDKAKERALITFLFNLAPLLFIFYLSPCLCSTVLIFSEECIASLVGGW